ncbi:MAG: hypothetical protein GY868_17335 [Deltaproteobacteria bacterium]|nr:hypothetical protein [Deltaproteobacteria bacterium]
MKQSDFGRRCIRLYYRHGPEVTGILAVNEALRAEVRECVMLVLQSRDQGFAGDAVGNVIRCLEKLSAYAGRQLQVDVGRVVAGMNELYCEAD